MTATQQVVESTETRSLSESGGRLSGRRSFFVWDDTAPITQPIQIDFGVNGLPDRGDLFPGESEIFAATFEIELVAGSTNTWRVIWNYASNSGGSIPDSTEPSVPTQPGFVQFSAEVGGVFKDAWRSPPSMTYWGPTYADADISGRKIDCAGEPLSVLVTQTTFQVEETVGNYGITNRFFRYLAYMGARNSSQFLGCPAGTLLYLGASMRRVSISTYSVSHRMLYDQWAHAVQQPKRNSSRQVEVEQSTFPFASWVRWVQPFPITLDFRALSENF